MVFYNQTASQRPLGGVGLTGFQQPSGTSVRMDMPHGSQAQGLGQMANQQAQARKGGGEASHVLAHFNKRELAQLSQLQGGEQKDKKTGLPVIDLSHAFNNHHVMDHVKKHIMRHLKTGGLASEGRFGDNTIASVEKNTSDALNYCQGGATINPHTGLTEHFGLSSVLSGLSSIASSAGPTLAKYAAPAATLLGVAKGNQAGSAATTPEQSAVSSPFAGMDSAAKQKFYDEYLAQRSGGHPAAPQPTPQGGGEETPSWMSGLSDMMSGKQNPMDTFKNFGKQAFEAHKDKLPGWAQGAAQTGMDMMEGKTPRDALKQYGSGMMQEHGSKLPGWAQGAAQTGMDMLNGQDPRQAAAQYGKQMMDHYGGQLPTLAQQGGQSAMNMMQGADPQEEAMNYGQGITG